MAGLALEMLLIAEIDQGVEIGDAFDHDVAALAAIAAVGTAEFDVFLAPKAAGAGATVTAFQEDFGLVEKLQRGATFAKEKGNGCSIPLSRILKFRRKGAYASGFTETKVRPSAFLANSTLPSTRANKV